MSPRFTTPFVLAALALALAAPPVANAAETTLLGAADVLAQRSMRNKALRAAKVWAQRNPERYARLVPPGTDLDPGSLPIDYALRDGGTGQTMVDSPLHTVLGLGYTELKGRDPANLGRLYTQLFALLPPEHRSGLLDPAQVVGLPLGQLRESARHIGDRVVGHFEDIRVQITKTLPIPGLAVNPIGDCSAETGWEPGGADTENSARCATADYAGLGLMKNLDWLLKDDLTCVKDQANRGTCVAHTVAANVETMIRVQGGAPENLAEQDLYFWAKTQTSLTDRYVDGLVPDEVYDALDAQDFRIQYERIWNYNQSPLRSAPPPAANNQFAGSCDLANYSGEMCTEYAFQAQEALIGPLNYLYLSPTRAATGWQTQRWTSLPDLGYAGLPDFQIDTAILFLEGEYPVHLSFVVPPSFRNPDANGYVQHNPGDIIVPLKGSHSALAVGFVANADLPAGAPPDPDGRGYVIVKNSWGTGTADCGFFYVSTEFLRQWAYAYRFLDKTVIFN